MKRPLIVSLELEDLPDSHDKTELYIFRLERDNKDLRELLADCLRRFQRCDAQISIHDQTAFLKKLSNTLGLLNENIPIDFGSVTMDNCSNFKQQRKIMKYKYEELYQRLNKEWAEYTKKSHQMVFHPDGSETTEKMMAVSARIGSLWNITMKVLPSQDSDTHPSKFILELDERLSVLVESVADIPRPDLKSFVEQVKPYQEVKRALCLMIEDC